MCFDIIFSPDDYRQLYVFPFLNNLMNLIVYPFLLLHLSFSSLVQLSSF